MFFAGFAIDTNISQIKTGCLQLPTAAAKAANLLDRLKNSDTFTSYAMRKRSRPGNDMIMGQRKTRA